MYAREWTGKWKIFRWGGKPCGCVWFEWSKYYPKLASKSHVYKQENSDPFSGPIIHRHWKASICRGFKIPWRGDAKLGISKQLQAEVSGKDRILRDCRVSEWVVRSRGWTRCTTPSMVEGTCGSTRTGSGSWGSLVKVGLLTCTWSRRWSLTPPLSPAVEG